MSAQRIVHAATQLSGLTKQRNYKLQHWTTAWGDDLPVYDNIKRHLIHLAGLHKLNVFDFYEHAVPFTDLGLRLKPEERDYLIELEGTEIVTKKIPGQLQIRLNRNNDIEFQAISPFFHEKDGFRKVKALITPVSPDEFKHEILPNIVIEWLEYIFAWEKGE